MTESDYKIPELVAIENDLQSIAHDMREFLHAVERGDVFHKNQPTALFFQSLVERSRIAYETFKGATASQHAYEHLKSASQDAMQKRAVATYADCLVTEFTQLHNSVVKQLRQIASDSGTRELEGARRIANNADVPADIIERVYRDTITEFNRITDSVKSEYEENRQPEKVS